MATRKLEWHADDHVMVLTLNDPGTRNALAGDDLFGAFEEAVDRANGDPDIRCLVLTGRGPVFSSGGNIHEMRAREGMFAGSPDDIARQYREGMQRIPRALKVLDVPIIAAVNGPAIGAGCDLACMCDIRIASTTARFAQSFVRLGIVSGDGGTWFLSRVVGPSRAAELALTGDSIDASTALAWGLVSRVVEPDALHAEARRIADRIARNPPLAVRWTKRLLREAQSGGLDAVLDLAATLQGQAHHTADHGEALAAHFEKRAGRFEGR